MLSANTTTSKRVTLPKAAPRRGDAAIDPPVLVPVSFADQRVPAAACKTAKGRRQAAVPPASNPLDIIDRNIQSLAEYQSPSLQSEIDRLVHLNDIRSMIALYEYYAAAGEQWMLWQNSGRVVDSEILEAEANHLWAKAYLVADHLKRMKPDDFGIDYMGSCLFNATMQMTGDLGSAIAVARAISEAYERRPRNKGQA